VRVHLEQAQVENAALIPQQAVTRNEKGNFVMIVAEDGSVAPRPFRSVSPVAITGSSHPA
jgi:membrane fusion protein (multidrug efflux system)